MADSKRKNITLRRLGLAFAAACVVAAVPAALYAESVPTPGSAEGVRVVTAKEAAGVLYQAGFFDMRYPVNYGRGHLPGAVSLPYKGDSLKKADFVPSPEAFDADALPEDKSTLIVFYSHGKTGWKSYLAARVAVGLGYTRVMWMRGGVREWTSEGYPLER